MENLIIQVKPRHLRGRKNKSLRKNKWIPAVVYGGGQKNLSFSLDIRDAEKYSKREYENKIFTFQSEDSGLNGIKAIKKETIWHIVKRIPVHMDFLSLDMKAPIKVHVEIRFEGRPKGVQEGGIFNISLRSLEVECLPEHIPQFIVMNVSELDINENLHVSDVIIPDNIKLITPPTRTLCAISEVQEETQQTTEKEASSDSPAPTESSEKEQKQKETKKTS